MHQDGHPLMPSRDRLPSDLTTAGPSYPLPRGRPLSFVVAVCLAAPRPSRGGVSSGGGRGGDVLDAPGTWKVTPAAAREDVPGAPPHTSGNVGHRSAPSDAPHQPRMAATSSPSYAGAY